MAAQSQHFVVAINTPERHCRVLGRSRNCLATIGRKRYAPDCVGVANEDSELCASDSIPQNRAPIVASGEASGWYILPSRISRGA